MIIHSHPTGNFNVRMTAKALYEAKVLKEFHSCLCLPKQNFIIDILGGRVREEYERRVFSEIPERIQYNHPYKEIARIANQKLNIFKNVDKDRHVLSVNSIYKDFDRKVASRLKEADEVKAVYAYEDGARDTFRQAKVKGIKSIYDLPIGYWKSAREIYKEESEREPEWACTLTGLEDSDEKLKRKEEELEMADTIIVASKFTKKTLTNHNINEDKINIVPYCTPQYISNKEPRMKEGPLKVLFVGSLTQRKGISYAINAVEQLGRDVELTIIGKRNTLNCSKLNTALEKYTWIDSLPHNKILEQMRLHDVLLFPTLFEGFGLVITEALSQGLPIITTKNCGGPECIRDGREGYIVPIRNSNAISACLETLSKDRNTLNKMKVSCIERAKYLNYKCFSTKLNNVIERIIKC